MASFVDRIQQSIEINKSWLVAGFDPVIATLPEFIICNAQEKFTATSDIIRFVLDQFTDIFLAAVDGQVAAVKPNIAFFEQYGIPGLSAFARFCEKSKSLRIPLIVDAKRGDIGSTAKAYSAAFLGRTLVGQRSVSGFDVDALTISPFLGFDTLEPFMEDAINFEKGLFVLLQTSNPGAKDIQGLHCNGASVSDHIAKWISDNSSRLLGTSGWSGLGAVVGASYPNDAIHLRALLPDTLFLCPGFGAQGAVAKDAVAGFAKKNQRSGGGVVNVSRGLLEGKASSHEEFVKTITERCIHFNLLLSEALV